MSAIAAKGLCKLGSQDGFDFAGKLLASQDRFAVSIDQQLLVTRHL